MLKSIIFPFIIFAWSTNVFATCIQPLFDNQELRLNPNLLKLQVSANSSKLKEGVYLLEGDVIVQSNTYAISSDMMSVDTNTKIYNAKGNVQVQTENIQAQSEDLQVDASSDDIVLQIEQMRYDYNNSLANGVADKVTILDNSEHFENATYTTCDINDPAWQLVSDSIILDKESNKGKARNTSFEFFGVRLLTMPEYEWVLEGRESGVLFPSFESYKRNNEKGYKAKLPYYINLAPHYDMTLTPGIISSRGKTLGIEYRHLLAPSKQEGYFEWDANFLSKDKITGNNRWILQNTYNQQFDNISLSANINRASDAQYARDVEFNNSLERLESNIFLKYENDGWLASVFSETEQVMNGTPLYTKDSEITVKKTLESNNIDYSASVINTQFNHKDNTKVSGNRSHAQVQASSDIINENIVITPKIFLNTTKYSLNNTDDKERNIFGVNIGAELFYERDVNIFGNNLMQTLTPRLAYFYTPYRDQSSLPNFDSEQQSLNYDSLFSNSSWSGLDRIDSASTFALGFESRLLNVNGKSLLTANIGRNINVKTKKKSNLFFSVEGSYNNLHLYNSLEYDSKIVARNSLLSVRKDGTHFTSIGHHLSDNDEYASLHTSVPISGRSHVFAGFKRSLNEHITNKQTAGIVYGSSCCFAIRAAHSKNRNTSSNSFDSVTSIEFIFEGFSTSDSGLYQEIKQNIPEYTNDSY